MDKRLFWLLITTATVVATVPVQVPAPAPAPADDCTWAFSKVTDCTTFLLNGSSEDEPNASCCGGVTSIAKTSPECICTVVELASHLGLTLNMTRLLHLPQLCKISLPPGAGDCDVDVSPSPSPGIIPPSPSPGTPPTPPVAEPPTPAASPTPPVAEPPTPGTSPTPPVTEPPTTTPPSSPAPPVDEPPTPNPPSPPLAPESSTSNSKLQSRSFMVLISLGVAGLSISHF